MSRRSEDYNRKPEEDKVKGGVITRLSLKRARRQLAAAVVFATLSLLMLVGYIVLYNNSIISKERSCWTEEQAVENLAKQYAKVNGFTSLPAYIEDVPGFDSVARDCPDGGTYTWNPVTGEYSCSEHQHYPDGFGQAESVNQGTNVTVTNGNDNGSN